MKEESNGVALVHTICPICRQPMDDEIVISSRRTEKNNKKVDDMHNKYIFNEKACKNCHELSKHGTLCIGIDEKQSEGNSLYITGEIAVLKYPERIFKVDVKEYIRVIDKVKFLYIDKEGIEQLKQLKDEADKE